MKDLSNKTVPYRTIAKKGWINPDTKAVDAEAFMLRFLRREGKYEKTLSSALKLEHTYNRLNKCYGVISF